MTPAQLFESMPEHLDAAKAAGADIAVMFDLDGDDGGRWIVHVVDGACNVENGGEGRHDATIKMADEDYVAMMQGRLNPMSAFMSGKIKVAGDMSKALKLQSLFRQPG